jgi:hypothetical protein
MTQTIAALESKLDGLSLEVLAGLLKQIDTRIFSARKAAEATNDYSQVMAMNSLRIALINKIEELDAGFHTQYVSAKVGA